MLRSDRENEVGGYEIELDDGNWLAIRGSDSLCRSLVGSGRHIRNLSQCTGWEWES